MSQSLSRLYVHIVFHVKYFSVTIRNEEKDKLYAYMGSVLKSNHCIPIIINGVENHVHILCIMSKNIALAKLVEEIKRHSSRWIKTQDDYYKTFAWQGGYGGFSVDYLNHDKIKNYIKNQEEHHRTKDFKEEYIDLLKMNKIDYDERYLWND